MLDRLRESVRMPLRFLRGACGRLALTVVALGLGVGLVCAIDLVNRAVFRAFVEIVDTMAGRAALQVSAAQGGLFSEDVAATVGTVAGVELAVPVVGATAFTADESGEALTVHGVDLTNEAAVRVYETRDHGGFEGDDPLAILNQPDSVLLTRSFAGRRGLSIGDAIPLVTPTGKRRFVVRALLEPEGVARVYGGNFAVMDLFAAEAAFTQPGFVNRVDVVVRRDSEVERVREAVAQVLPAGLQVETPAQRKADLHKVMHALHTVLDGVGWLGLVAAFLIAFNRLTTVFEDRVSQLGVLRAVGVRRQAIWQELAAEGCLLGAAGVALGIPLGIGLGHVLLPLIAATTALHSNLGTPAAEIEVRFSSLGLAIGLGLGAAVLAAALPAWRSARASIAETLRRRGLEQPRITDGGGWVVPVLSAVIAGGAVVVQSATGSAAWGLVASVMLVMAAAFAARPLLDGLFARLLPAVRPAAGPAGRLALATLVLTPRRTALTVATMGVGFAAVVWLATLAHSFEESVLAIVPGVFRGDLSVSSAHNGSGFLEAPLDGQVLTELKAIHGVGAVVGEQVREWRYGEGPIAIDAFDSEYFNGKQFGEWPLVGRRNPDVWAAVARGDAAIMSENLSRHFNVRVGDTITLSTPGGPLPLRIAGMIINFLSPDGTLVLSREVYQRQWNDPQIVRGLVRVSAGADASGVRRAIAAALGEKYSLRVLSLRELIQWFVVQVQRAFSTVYILAGMVLLVVMVGVADTLAAGVIERTHDFGVLRATGVARHQVWRIVLTEGALLAALGLALASLTGLALGTLWVDATFPYLLGWALELYIPYTRLVVIAMASMLVCLAAALVPARRAAHLEPAVALRYE
jgi:putative ABC transport system permease protein